MPPLEYLPPDLNDGCQFVEIRQPSPVAAEASSGGVPWFLPRGRRIAEGCDVSGETPPWAGRLAGLASLGLYRQADDQANEVSLRASSLDVSCQSFGTRVAGQDSEQRYQDLHNERATILKRDIDGRASTGDQAKLKLIEWELDQIESARHGARLDAIQGIVDQQRKIASLIIGFGEEVRAASGRERRPNPRSRRR